MKHIITGLLLSLMSTVGWGEETQLMCFGEMTIGGDGADVSDGLGVTLSAAAQDAKITVMDNTYNVQKSATEYAYEPKWAKDHARSLNRFTLSMTWIVPDYHGYGALVFEGKCQQLGAPKI